MPRQAERRAATGTCIRTAPKQLSLPLLTPRLRLRDLQAADAAAEVALLEGLYADERVTAQMPFWPYGHTATVNHVKRQLQAQQARQRRVYELVVEVRRTGSFAGLCGLVVTTAAADVKRGNPRTAELGYVLAANRWGHGYATELVQHLLRAAWEPLGLERVEAIIAKDHRASAKVLQRAGFQWEASLPKFTRVRGRSWDCELYAAASAPPAPRSPRGGRRG
jgi:ribosomal-protein-alanine N-acetyltransferase